MTSRLWPIPKSLDNPQKAHNQSDLHSIIVEHDDISVELRR